MMRVWKVSPKLQCCSRDCSKTYEKVTKVVRFLSGKRFSDEVRLGHRRVWVSEEIHLGDELAPQDSCLEGSKRVRFREHYALRKGSSKDKSAKFVLSCEAS